MKKLFPFVLALALAGCSNSPNTVTTSPKSAPGVSLDTTQTASVPDFARLTLAGSITSGNVTIYPITSTQPSQKELDDMVTLDEAKRKDWVEITEQADETVEFLEVKNTGPKAIFLMGGEILLGGKQDRIVSKDTIVKPGETVKVPVYCVDQGRWSETYSEFKPTGKMAPHEVRKAATVDNDQTRVWSKVAGANKVGRTVALGSDVSGVAALPTLNGSESIKSTLDTKLVQKRQAEADPIIEALRKQDNVIGIVIVVNGEIQGFEYFGSNTFFEKAVSSILKGVFTDSLVAEKSKSKVTATMKDASAFVADCLKGKSTKVELLGGYSVNSMDSADSDGVTIGGSPSAAGSDSGLYRGSYFKKK
jgi:hypothetical protein